MDPDGRLSKSERDRAIRLAGTHRSTRKIGGRDRPVLVERLVRSRAATPPNRAVVAIHDHRAGRSVVVAVDLDRDRVISAQETPAQFQLDPEERRQAERLARRDPRVKEFLRGRPMDPLTRLYFPPARSRLDRRHRYAIVFLRPSKSDRRYAVIDLSIGGVATLLAPRDLVNG